VGPPTAVRRPGPTPFPLCLEDRWEAGCGAKPSAGLKSFSLHAETDNNPTQGAALAILQGGKTVYEKGFGVRQLGKPDRVTPETLFLIGSTSKSLTTLLMARLVDEGRLGWDTPIVKVLPDFALGDEAMTRKLTLQNTVCACTGMPRQDLEMLFEYDGVTVEQRLAEMRQTSPCKPGSSTRSG